MTSKSFSYNFATATINRFVSNALAFLFISLITRSLGPTVFGHYSTVITYLFIAIILADMGLQVLLTREISQKPEQESNIVSALTTLRLFVVIGIAMLASIAIWFFPYIDLIKWGVLLASSTVIFSSMSQVLVGVFQKHMQIYRLSFADVVLRAVQLGLALILLEVAHLDLLLVLAINVVAEIIHIGIVLYFVKKLTPLSIRIDVPYWKSILPKALPVAVSFVFTLLYFRIDTIFLSLLRDGTEVGIYALGYKILEIIIVIPAIYVGLLMPSLSQYANSSAEEFIKIFKRAVRFLLILALPVVTYLLLFAGDIVSIVGGSAYGASVEVVRILVPAIFVIFLANLAGHGVIALDQQRRSMWAYGFGAFMNIVLNLIFIPKYGYIAAAWTTVATEIVVTALLFAIVFQTRPMRFIDFRITFIFIAAFIISGIWYLLRDFFWIATIISVMYPLILVGTGAVTKQQLILLLKGQA